MLRFPITYFEYETRQHEPPVWPLPSLGNHHPTIVGPGVRCGTVELSYERLGPKFLMMPVIACGHGEISFATDDKLILDHGHGFTTSYTSVDIVLAQPRSIRARNVAPRVKRGDIIAFVAARKALTFEIGRHDDKRTYVPLEFSSHVPHWEIAAWAAPANEQIIELPRVAA